jgi:hypothetical protein
MSNVNSPSAEIGLTQKDIESKPAEASHSEQVLAQANGRAYNSFLDVFLDKNNKEARQQQLAEIIKELPQHARGLYERGLQTFQGELQANHTLLEAHRGEEEKYLINELISSRGKTQEEIAEVSSHITPDQSRFVEPTEGIGIIQVDDDLYDYLCKALGKTKRTDGICFTGDKEKSPSFIMVRKDSPEREHDEESLLLTQNLIVRHESHHLAWNFLERERFVREPQESSPELSKAFGYFRNELAAYIISGTSLTEIEANRMTYADDDSIQKLATDTKNLAHACMKIARGKGINSESFIYPAMISRNFAELKTNLLKLTPVDKQMREDTVSLIYKTWDGRIDILESIRLILAEKHATISPDVMLKVALDDLSNPKIYDGFTCLRDIQREVDVLVKFSRGLAIEGLSADDLLMKTLRGKLPFSDESIKDILNMQKQIKENIPLVNESDKFTEKFVSMWGVEDDTKRAAYKQLINASPEMRSSFDNLKDEILTKGEREIKNEYGYNRANEDRRRQIDEMIRKRVELLKTL